MTYKDVVDRIQDAVSRHKMLADFGYGQLSDIKVLDDSNDGADYPYAFLLPTGISRAQSAVTYSFSLIVMEMAQTPREILTVQSDCLQYIDDLVADLRFSDFKGDVSLTQTTQVFRERFQDEVAGATLNMQIVVADPINECEAPVERNWELVVEVESTLDQFRDPEAELLYIFQDVVTGADAWKASAYIDGEPNYEYRVELTADWTFVPPVGSEALAEPPFVYSPSQGSPSLPPFGAVWLEADETIGWPTEVTDPAQVYPVTQTWDIAARGEDDYLYRLYIQPKDTLPEDESIFTMKSGANLKIYKRRGR